MPAGSRYGSQVAVSGSERDRVSRAAGIVGFYTLLSRVLGLVRDIVVAGFFGSGIAADAFFVAFRIPNLLRRLFAEGSLTISFIPVFTEYLHRKTRDEAFELARVILTLLTLILVFVTLAGILLSPWIVRIQAFGFGSAGVKYELTVLLTRITFPYILIVSLVAFFMGVLNSLRHFAAPAAAPIFLNAGIIGSTLWISPHLSEPVLGVAIGVIIGGVLQVALQIPWVIRIGLSLKPRWRPTHPAVKRIGILMLPAVFGSAVYQFNQFIGTLLASFLPQGSISYLYYADRLVQFPLGVFAIAISTAVLPSLSKTAAAGEPNEFRRTLDHALKLVSFITIPSAVGLAVLGEPIIKLFFQRGAFDPAATLMTYKALICYAVGLWAFSGLRVLVSAFYAVQDTKTPVMVAAGALAANLIFSLLLMGPLRHGGLALALSLASSIQLGLLVFMLRRRLGGWGLGPISGSAARHLVSAAIMGLAVHALRQEWGMPGEGTLAPASMVVVYILAGSVVYFASALALGCREPAAIVRNFRPIFKR